VFEKDVPAEDVLGFETAIVVDKDVDEDLGVVTDLQQTVENHSLGLRGAVVALEDPQKDLGEVDRDLVLLGEGHNMSNKCSEVQREHE
jgi:hypothetical protein